MMKSLWLFGCVVVLVVGRVGAQEGSAQRLTPDIIYTSEVADVDAPMEVLLAPVADVAVCRHHDCLSYQASSTDIQFVDISHTPETYKTLVWDDVYAWSPVLSPDDRYAILQTYAGASFLIDLETDERVYDIASEERMFYWSDSGKQFVAHTKTATEVWDAESGTLLFQVPDWGLWNHDETLIFAYQPLKSSLLTIYDAKTGAKVGQIDSGSPIGTLATNATNNNIVISGQDVSLWNLDTRQKIFTFAHNDRGEVLDYNDLFSYSDDGSALITRNDGLWTVWNTNDQTVRFTLPQTEDEEFLRPFWNKTGTYFLVDYRSPRECEDNCTYGIYVWDAATGEILVKREGLVEWRSYWTPNNRYIISEQDEQTFLIWDALTGSPLFELQHPESIHYEEWAFNSDGSKLVVWTDKRIYLWTIPQP